MASLFTRIIKGEIPGRFIWKDERAVAILTIAPLRPGHVLVIPRQEVDHWLDLAPELAAHLIHVAQNIGKAIQAVYSPAKVGLSIIGLEVRHVHLHLVPIDGVSDMNFGGEVPGADAAALDEAAAKLRKQLSAMGFAETSN